MYYYVFEFEEKQWLFFKTLHQKCTIVDGEAWWFNSSNSAKCNSLHDGSKVHKLSNQITSTNEIKICVYKPLSKSNPTKAVHRVQQGKELEIYVRASPKYR